jgi:gluconokinase
MFFSQEVYHDILRQIPSYGRVIFVYFKGTAKLLRTRIQNRQSHCMHTLMLQSQSHTLEEPKEAEERVIIASIIPKPDTDAKNIVATAVEGGYLPAPSNILCVDTSC